MKFVILGIRYSCLRNRNINMTKEDKPDKMLGFFQNLFLNTAYNICGKFCKGIRISILKFRGR
jgi:hypothetical protein